jgi:hypothetical protein
MNDEFPKKTAKEPHQSPSRKRESAVGHGLPSVKGSADSLFLVAQFSKLFLDGSEGRFPPQSSRGSRIEEGETMRLTGFEAIAFAEREGLTLNKAADNIDEAVTGLSIAEAEAIATEDPDLIWLDVPEAEAYEPRNMEPGR